MAGPNLQPNPDSESLKTDFFTVLASETVHFLLSGDTKVPLPLPLASVSLPESTLPCLYFSAIWCRPCKSFTPQLLQIYESLRKRGKELEIIFVSLDHDEDAFNHHFGTMPWLALPFNAHLRHALTTKFRVDRIPSLIPLISDGLQVQDDLVGLLEDYGADAFPFTTKRRLDLKTADDAMRRRGVLQQLSTHHDRNYLVSRDGKKVMVSQLFGKTVGLFFGAYWSPPCCAFTAHLVETYNELVSSRGSDCFQVVLVSTDQDRKEFDVNVSGMPWLAFPFDDRRRKDLCRIFNIKAIPALVLIGTDGSTISTDGKGIISLYGPKAFPFTESRISELDASLKKEGDALPQQIKDKKHQHVLKLDMAKAYVCDSCKAKGRFWAFSCHVCNYDLHPTCISIEQVSQ